MNILVNILLPIIFMTFKVNNNLMEYYYPVNQDVKIYEYVNPNDPNSTEYWKVTSNNLTKTILTESFDNKFNLYNSFLEIVHDQHSELIKYSDYEIQDDGKYLEISSNVVKKIVFSSDEIEPYSYAVEYENKYGKFYFEKGRRFLGFEEIVIHGKKYSTAKFQDAYLITLKENSETYTFKQITFYAKEIGMVKYERIYPDGKLKILELEKILSEEEFQKLIRA